MVDHAITLRGLRPAEGDPVCRALALTVVVADEAAAVRATLRSALSAAGIAVVAEASSGAAGARAALRHRPGVLVLDHCRPGGIAAIAEVRRSLPDTAVLAFSAASDEESVLAAMRAGARGYLLTGAAPEDIVRVVRGVAAGQAIFCHNVAHRVLDLIAKPRTAPVAGLTARERQVLHLRSAGLGNTEIARRLHLAPKTIRNHARTIQAKLGGNLATRTG